MAGLWEPCVGVIILLVSTTLFIMASAEEESLNCYQCHSARDPDCKLLLNTTAYLKPCLPKGENKPFCRKIIQKIYARGGLEIVFRKCGWIQHASQDCYTGRNIDRYQNVCQCFTEGCNSAPRLLQSLSVVIVTLVPSVVVLYL